MAVNKSLYPYPLGQESSAISSQTVGATSVLLATAKYRDAYAITNTSTGGQTLTIALQNAPAVAGSGIVLTQGQQWVDGNVGDYRCWSGQVNVIMSAAGGSVSIWEKPTY